VKLDDGSLWRNVVTEAKSKVAQTLDDYRGNFAYNMLDASKRRFAARCPSWCSGTTMRCATTGIPAS
jgi:alkaline phosphatase D